MRVKQNPQNNAPRFDGSGDISIYLVLFEKQMSRLSVFKENSVMYLLGLLQLEFVNIERIESCIQRNQDGYDYEKYHLLKPVKLTTEEFRQKCLLHRNQQSANWQDFVFQLRNYFGEWIQGINVDNFEKVKELIITD